MELVDAIKHVKAYRELASSVDNYSSKQQAIDALTLEFLDGDVEKLRAYRKSAMGVDNYSSEQIAIDALHLVLLTSSKGKNLLSKIE